MSNFTIDDILAGISDSLNKLQERKELASQPVEKTSNSSFSSESSATESPSKYTSEYYKSFAKEYIEFTYKNPTIYHVVEHFSSQLTDNGFTYISEKDNWTNLKPGKYFTTRNGSSLSAFYIGKDWTPEKGVGAIGSHIDSLTTVLKPNSTKEKIDGYELLGVAPYAGTLGTLWLDRDLGIGGRLLIKDKDNKINQKLIDSTPNPIAHIPTLAPHFGEIAFQPINKETKSIPVIGFSQEPDPEPTEAEKNAPLYGKHSLKLLRYIAKLANVKVEQISQWDLQLYDVQKGSIGGLNEEFIFAPRVDDRICSFAGINALIEASNENKLGSDSFSIVSLYDNEEIGSATRAGAKGGLFELVIERILSTKYLNPNQLSIQDKLRQTYANSIILSADVIHLLNPNYQEAYLENHKPIPNKGISLTLDPNGNMATDSIGISLVEQLGKLNNDEIQYFQIRNDGRSGSTIGPSISSQTGARTIDLGIPQLSMHSIRATVGSKDVGLGIKFFYGFFKSWRKTYDEYVDL
ncbi:uncharacterized protein KGF55_000426 [Candida pseudojiufengensis]|uniref:uncharacterized protein n=1 Tax=Candida pseudojiufengensis TaxID=497109 RepID=UPI00222483A0|nr:uncharacterized protein KGF55_000426 [Candida pseudojiufengensis]KAI5967016.1 hypothetical protein KGF55_000426 [Candida pseudojiufengensis]